MPELPTIGVDLRALVGHPTGIGFYTQGLLQELATSGFANYLGLAHTPVSVENELERFGVQLEYQGAPLGVLWQQLVLPRRLRRGDLDLYWSPLLTLPLRQPLPAVVTVHDLTTLLYPETHRLKVRLSILPFLERSLESARRIAADSHATARDLRRFFPANAKKVRVVYPGIDADFRPADPERVAAIRDLLGCPDGYLLSVGTVEPRKNLPVLLDAWESLRQRRPETPPLIVAGPYGWHSRSLMRRIRMLERQGLRYLQRVDRDELVQLFQAARIFVLPSLYEGFGLPAAEAMACGVPTVVSDRSSLPEVVADGGVTVAPDDASDLAATLQRILEDPVWTRELSERARARATQFSWPRAAREMEVLFREALE